MKVLVTGGAGFIASHIIDRLIALNHEVAIVDNLSTGKRENINLNAKFYECDITNYETLKLVFNIERPEIVIHHAAQISVQTSLEKTSHDAAHNIMGTINLLECCKEFKIQKIIFASSAAVYGNPQYLAIDENHPVQPISFYGVSKNTGEYYIRLYSELHGIKYTIFRYANVYGMRQDAKGEGGVISIFVDKMLSGETPCIYGDGEQTRDFIYVKDIAEANILALYKGDNETINISSNTAITVNKLFSIVRDASYNNMFPIYKNGRDGDIRHSYLNNNKALDVLQWRPKYNLEEGLRETILYYTDLASEKEGEQLFKIAY